MEKKPATTLRKILCFALTGLLLFIISVASIVRTIYANIGGNGPLSFSDYRRLDSEALDYEGSGLSELAGIERCKQLRELSVSGCDITDFSPLYGLGQLSRLNALGCELSPEQYEELRSALPDCDILWDVPFRGARVRSDSVESLELSDDDGAFFGMLRYFPRLDSIDINNCSFTPELLALIDSMPQCDFSWSVEISGKTFSGHDELIDLNEIKVGFDQLCGGLEKLPFAKRVELCDSGLSNGQMERLMELFPDKKFVWRIYLGHWALRTDVTSFSTGHIGFVMTSIPNDEGQQLKYCRDLVAQPCARSELYQRTYQASLADNRRYQAERPYAAHVA